MTLKIDTIKEQLRKLSYSQALSFCYLLCKKSFPDYALFSEFEDFGKPKVLYTGLIALRKHISTNNHTAQLEQLTEDLWEDEDIAPDTDDFPGNLSASLALNTVSLFYHSFKFALEKDYDSVCRVAETALNSVEMYYVVGNNLDQNQPKEAYHKMVNEALVVQSELLTQRNLIETIRSLGEENARIYTHIRMNDSRLTEHSLHANFIYT